MKYFSIEIDGVEGALAPIENLHKAREEFTSLVNLDEEQITDKKKLEKFREEKQKIVNAKVRIYKVQRTETKLNLIDDKEIMR